MAISFWSDDNKLIYANKVYERFSKKDYGYDMVPGTNRIEYVKHSDDLKGLHFLCTKRTKERGL